MAAGDHLTAEALAVGAVLCVLTHGVFIATGFEGTLYQLFNPAAHAGHMHSVGAFGASYAGAGIDHAGHLHGAFQQAVDVGAGAVQDMIVEPASKAMEMFAPKVPSEAGSLMPAL